MDRAESISGPRLPTPEPGPAVAVVRSHATSARSRRPLLYRITGVGHCRWRRRGPELSCGGRRPVQHLLGPIGTVTVAARADGEKISKVTQAGPVTMTPPVKPVKRGPHTGSRTLLREAAMRTWPERVLNSSPMRDGDPYTSLAPKGRVIETVAKGAADAETARNAL